MMSTQERPQRHRATWQDEGTLPQISPLGVRLFTVYAKRYMRRAFHALRLARAGMPPPLPATPVVIYCNHPSWWDPLWCFILARHCWPLYRHYAPMDATALARYRFFARLGFFGIAPGTRHGAATFLRTSQSLLQRPRTALWVTPQGHFVDPRQRPVHLQGGVGHLARRLPEAVFLPLALEYPFWEERFPEALAWFGAPLHRVPGQEDSAAQWTERLAQHLTVAQEQLAVAACQRQRDAFTVLLPGRVGVGGLYDLWRRLQACWQGQAWHGAHGSEE